MAQRIASYRTAMAASYIETECRGDVLSQDKTGLYILSLALDWIFPNGL